MHADDIKMFKYKNKSVYICHYIAGKLRKYITNLESYLTTIYNNRKIILLFTNTEMLSQNIYASIWTILNKKDIHVYELQSCTFLSIMFMHYQIIFFISL